MEGEKGKAELQNQKQNLMGKTHSLKTANMEHDMVNERYSVRIPEKSVTHSADEIMEVKRSP